MSQQADQFGVYIHFPFCRSRCHYCDFPAVATSEPPHRSYAQALLRELRQQAAGFSGFTLSSIYVGGGTPSLWHPDELARVLDGVRDFFPRTIASPEVTLELNPADVTAPLLAALAAAGINRLSLGVQSFQDRTLTMLGRRHDSGLARQALATARASVVPRLTFDLIYGVPGQRPEDWEAELEEALTWEKGHLSVYCLSLEPRTPLGLQVASGALQLPEEEAVLAMAGATHRQLGGAGLPRYEVSNYARPGEESRHNLLYWEGAPYLGLGAGAHSHLPGPEPGQAHRWANVSEPAAYLSCPEQSLAFAEQLGPAETGRERLICSLRLARGLDLAAHRLAGGEDLLRTRADRLTALRRAGLIELVGDRLRLTDAGFAVADAVIRMLA